MNDAPLANEQQVLDALLESLAATGRGPHLEPAQDHRAGWRVVSAEGASSVVPEPPRKRSKSRDTSTAQPAGSPAPDIGVTDGRRPAAVESSIRRPAGEPRSPSANAANASLTAADFAGRTVSAPIQPRAAASLDPGVAPGSGPAGAGNPARELSVDRELARLLAAWPTLSADVRSALLAVVDAACERLPG